MTWRCFSLSTSIRANRTRSQSRSPDARQRLPARTTSFVGRDRELDELVQMTQRDDGRLVTLTGLGGIGKTRLAVEAARALAPRFRDGVGYVALERLDDPDLVPIAIADAIGLAFFRH